MICVRLFVLRGGGNVGGRGDEDGWVVLVGWVCGSGRER